MGTHAMKLTLQHIERAASFKVGKYSVLEERKPAKLKEKKELFTFLNKYNILEWDFLMLLAMYVDVKNKPAEMQKGNLTATLAYDKDVFKIIIKEKEEVKREIDRKVIEGLLRENGIDS
jgi:hypothetical protein